MNSELNIRLQSIIPAATIAILVVMLFYQKNQKIDTAEHLYPKLKIISSLKIEEKESKISQEEVQVKTPEQILKEVLQKELKQIKNKLHDASTTLSTISHQLENARDEYNLELSKLSESKKGLESSKIEISKLRSEHQSILEEIQSAITDPFTIKLQHDQKEVEVIKEKIKSINDELLEINSKKK